MKENWNLVIKGEVLNPVVLDWKTLTSMPTVEKKLDFHCVTTWSLLDSIWTGVPFSEIINLVKPKSTATYILQKSGDSISYTTGTLISALNKEDVLLGFKRNGEDIELKHGGPVRIINPYMYTYKSAKWLIELEFLPEQKLGFWEERGYSEQADPLKEQRYSSDDI